MDIEGLGTFYMGKRWQAGAALDEPVLLDARTLTTHAVCVGMTGSGKTGLCVALLEEALLDGVPVLAIDPKGDLANLALTFPNLAPTDFAPWLDPMAAARENVSVDQLAERTATKWKDGLAAWGQGPERIARLRAAGDVTIYTPGSDAGVPLSMIASFAPPTNAGANDGDAWRDRLESVASGLLSLLGMAADPLTSREHVLIATLLDRAWNAGEAVTLAQLIERIVRPGLDRIGAFDLETYYPSAERHKLAMALNTVLASPGFATWLAGAPLDIARLLYTEQGKPRIAVISIAHLSDAERMFVVTTLMQEVVTWMRGQAGTQSLRALVFMDEVFGFLPPTAAPPSKKPILTLLKQARAFGIGVVLATQNPVDLDYKALANAGTWWLGRLQTERDKARVLDGLLGASATAGAAGTMDRAALDALLSQVTSRVFLMHSVHAQAPVLMQSRWAMSYLAGPMTRAQIAQVTKANAGALPQGATALGTTTAAPAPSAPMAATTTNPRSAPTTSAPQKPIVPSELTETFIGRGAMRPTLVGKTNVHYVGKAGVDVWRELVVSVDLTPESGGDFWKGATRSEETLLAAASATAPANATWLPLPSALSSKVIKTLDDQLQAFIVRECPLVLWTVPSLKFASTPAESQTDFAARAALAAREARDASIAKLEASYAPKLARIEEKLRVALGRVDKERAEANTSMMSSALSIGGGVLGALFGKKKLSTANVTRATSAAKSVSRAAQARGDIARAEETVDTLRAQLDALQDELAAAVNELSLTPSALDVVEQRIAAKKADLQITHLALVWRGDQARDA